MKKAVGYFRVSTDKIEQRESIENQRDLFYNYIKDKDMEFHDFYIDEGISGTGRKKRPEFDRMIADIDKGEIDVIIVKELSRLARNVEIASWTKSMAMKKNIRILSMDGQVDTFDESKNRMFGIFASIYENESQTTSARIKSVMQMKQKNGAFLGSIPPYGYYLENKKLIKRNDYTEDVVKEIFNLFLQGWGQEKIARHLDKQGYPTPSQLAGKSNAGRFWHGTAVKIILTNYHYMGHLVQHRQTSIDVTMAERVQVPKEEMIWVKNTHEPIIDENTFNLVQEKIESKKLIKEANSSGKTARYFENKHLFVNFLFCAECGSPYWWRKTTHGYLCGSRLKRGKSVCDNDIIREKHLVNIILNDIKSFLDEEIKIDIDKKIKKEQVKAQKKIDNLMLQIKSLESEKQNSIRFLIKGTLSEDDYKCFLDENSKKISQLHKEIVSLSELQKEKRLDISSIKSQLEEVLELKTLDRELLNMLVNRIEVSKSGELKVFYTFSPPKVYNYKIKKSID